jgi:hypothetical protein
MPTLFCVVGEPPDIEVKAPNERLGEDGDGEGDTEWLGQIHEDGLLDALNGEEVESVHVFGTVCDHGATGEVDAMEGPQVCL